ncbi:MAG: hypothetical protein J5944_04890 [Lentisphaeria bacterium]|nr:hypothetical protein [Lentisphaeria bacterium]
MKQPEEKKTASSANTSCGYRDFQDPPMEFRGAPFWSWNSKLEAPRLREQIRIMKKMGMGGFFMHSRVGLKTPYLGPEWFDCVKACIDEAEKEGLTAWLYDEDRWPSGAAGGIVTADDRFKMKELLMERAEKKEALSMAGTSLACFAAVFENQKVISYRRIGPEDALSAGEGETLVRCYYDFSARSSEFNGETYLDTLNDEAVRKFMEVTHEAYFRECGSDFGNAVPGIFTDEPCYALPYRGDVNLPWTVGFEKKFREKCGYDLCDGMIELFFDCGCEVSRFRRDYYDLLTELFVHAFSRQIGKWCEDHRVSLTGHVLWEDELDGQTAYIGSAMRFYEYMQIPGIDLLTERWTTYATAKQCTSVARQLGKKRRLCELYGCTGWDFPLFAHKSLGDWLYAMGINFRCHHLFWYSMEAEAKRDYPASISEHSPWYAVYSRIEDHFARLGSVIARGNEIRDILVIHPMESVWSVKYRIRKDWVPSVTQLNQEFVSLAETLLGENLDFDYGDEELLSRYASVNGCTLKVGCAEYKAVVVPALKTIRSSTLKLLAGFASAGGRVFCLGNPPEYVDAVRSGEARRAFAEFVPVDHARLTEELNRLCRRISLTDEQGHEIGPLLTHFSENGDDLSLFICNTGLEMSGQPMDCPLVRDRNLTFPNVKIAVTAEAGRKLYEFDTLSGKILEFPFRYENGKYLFSASFDALSSRLFVLSGKPIPGALPASEDPICVSRMNLNGTRSKILRDEPNVFILDHADVCIDGKTVRHNEFILLADDFLRHELGKPPRGGHMVQPYLRKGGKPERELDLQLKYTFECMDAPETDCMLALEHPELYSIALNGNVIDQQDAGFWIDPVLRKLRIPADFFRTGENELILSGKYHEDLPGLESLFLLGEFGVYDEKIGRLPDSIDWGDWCARGFPAYGGNFTYKMPLPSIPDGRSFLSVTEWRGSAVGIRINGSEEQLLISPPYRVELTDLLMHDGSDMAEIRIYGHRRNVFGPFYLKEKWPAWTGPAQFKILETEQRQTVPCGILSAPCVETI